MIDLVKQFLERYELLKPKAVFLVGFSGGADSLCLVDVLNKICKKYDISLVACHLNHNWRGEESLNDLKFCENFAKENNIEFFTKTLSDKEKQTETVARDLRYNFFEECIEKFDADAMFLAHNLNDNVETLVYRMIKGTGVNGICAIPEKRAKFYRPLLNISREKIENYCNEISLEFIVDSSNSDSSYNRNYIRNVILPEFSKINKNYLSAIDNLSSLAKENEEIVAEYLNIVYENIFDDEKIVTSEFIKLSTPVQKRVVLDILLSNGLDYSSKRINEILEFLITNSKNKCGAKTSLTEKSWLFASADFIEILTAYKKNQEYIKINKCGSYKFENFVFEIKDFDEKNDNLNFPKEEDLKAFVEIHQPIDFELRARKDGDFIQPLGMKGSMKLKKYLNSKSVKSFNRDKLVFLTSGKEVLWAPSLGVSEKLKVTNKPTHILSVKKVFN